ncbi:MAG: DUF1080 domain-containing protein [Bacteroidales bacterium]|jgi:hypothetical protein|nr:DUF1080 domain-containing protein [Bacteroidales bacterium]
MKKIFVVLWLLLFSVLSNTYAQSSVPEGFISLFNGTTFHGWNIQPDKGAWQVIDGVIRCIGTPNTPYLILTEKEYENFELYIDFKMSEGCNSGLFLHQTERSWGRESRNGMEIQIFDNAGRGISKNSCGAVYDQVPPIANPVKPAGLWNTYYIIMDWPFLKIWLNGQLIQDLNLENYPDLKYRLRKGYIGLQNHDHFVEFKNIYIKELPSSEKPWSNLFDGKNLSGWTKTGNATWKIENGVLIASGGSGYLISNDEFENYELQIFGKKYQNGGNSCIFYSWQNEKDMGYRTDFNEMKLGYQFPLIQVINEGNKSSVRYNGEEISFNTGQTTNPRGKIVLYHSEKDGEIKIAKIRIKNLDTLTKK